MKPKHPDHFFGLDEALAKAGSKFVQLNNPFCLFETYHFLRGIDNALLDLTSQSQLPEKLLDIIIEYQIGIAEEAGRFGQGRIHCIDPTDDVVAIPAGLGGDLLGADWAGCRIASVNAEDSTIRLCFYPAFTPGNAVKSDRFILNDKPHCT